MDETLRASGAASPSLSPELPVSPRTLAEQPVPSVHLPTLGLDCAVSPGLQPESFPSAGPRSLAAQAISSPQRPGAGVHDRVPTPPASSTFGAASLSLPPIGGFSDGTSSTAGTRPSHRRILALDVDDEGLGELDRAVAGTTSSKAWSPRKVGYPGLATLTSDAQGQPPTPGAASAGDGRVSEAVSPATSPKGTTGAGDPSPGRKHGSKPCAAESTGPPAQEKFMRLSERASMQEQLVTVLPHREFCFDEQGKVLCDFVEEHRPPAGCLADFQNVTDCVEAYKEWQQLRIALALVRSEINDKAALVAAHHNSQAWGFTEPPSTPVMRERIRAGRRKEATREALSSEPEEGAQSGTNAEDRFRDLCCELGLPASRLACRAVASLHHGGDRLPREFSGRGYLGNRCAQALFMTLVTSLDSEEGGVQMLNELRLLDLSGQGIGNEAALALADLLPRCPQLSELNLSRNSISEKGAQRLLKEVSTHPGLMYVNLEANPLPSWIRVHIKEEMRRRQESYEKKRRRSMEDAQRAQHI